MAWPVIAAHTRQRGVGVPRSMRSMRVMPRAALCMSALTSNVRVTRVTTYFFLLLLFVSFFFVRSFEILVLYVPVMASPNDQQMTSSGPLSVAETSLTTAGKPILALTISVVLG